MLLRRDKGFTLVEVLVALAILAVALAAAMRATSSLIDNASTLKEHLVAGWLAQNRLQEHLARRDFPDLGLQLARRREWHPQCPFPPYRNQCVYQQPV